MERKKKNPTPAVHSHTTLWLCKWSILIRVVYFGSYKSSELEPLVLVSWHFRVKHWLTAVKMASLFTVVALLAVLSGGLCEEKTFLQRAGTAFNSRQHRSMLTVSNGEKFGNWTWPEMCPDKFFAVGFSLRVKTLTRSHITDILINISLIKADEEISPQLLYKFSHSVFWFHLLVRWSGGR